MNKTLFDLLKENAINQLEEQYKAVESIDSKTGYLITAILGLPTVVIAIQKPDINIWLVLAAIVATISIYFAIKSIFASRVRYPLNIESFFKENENNTAEKIKLNYLNDYHSATTYNEEVLKTKGKRFNKALLAFCISIALLTISVLGGRWQQNMPNNNDNQQSGVTGQPPIQTPTQTNVQNQVNNPATNSAWPSDRQDTNSEFTKTFNSETTKGGIKK